MIFIVVRWRIRPERSEQWLSDVKEFTDATRAEPGNLFFDWSRSVDDPHGYVLVEAFRDDDAGAAHVQSDHFQKAIGWMGEAVVESPQIINVKVPQDDWSRMGEVAPR